MVLVLFFVAWLPALCRLRQEGFDPALFPLSSSLIYLSTKPTPCRPARELWHRHFADILFALDIDIVIVIAIGIVIVLVTLFPLSSSLIY